MVFLSYNHLVVYVWWRCTHSAEVCKAHCFPLCVLKWVWAQLEYIYIDPYKSGLQQIKEVGVCPLQIFPNKNQTHQNSMNFSDFSTK
jgi:hypothetical protein